MRDMENGEDWLFIMSLLICSGDIAKRKFLGLKGKLDYEPLIDSYDHVKLVWTALENSLYL
jgi:hypothetical protein